MRKPCLRWFETRKDTNELVQLQKLSRVGVSDKASIGIILSRQQTTIALIILRGCTG